MPVLEPVQAEDGLPERIGPVGDPGADEVGGGEVDAQHGVFPRWCRAVAAPPNGDRDDDLDDTCRRQAGRVPLGRWDAQIRPACYVLPLWDGHRGKPMSETHELADLLQGLKERSGRSYTALASRTGLSRSSVHRYCQGLTVPASFGTVERIARVCGAGPGELDRLYGAWARAEARAREAEAGAGAMNLISLLEPGVDLRGAGRPGSETALASAYLQKARETGVRPVQDIAPALGGEITFALDGPLMPLPSWKMEIY